LNTLLCYKIQNSKCFFGSVKGILCHALIPGELMLSYGVMAVIVY